MVDISEQIKDLVIRFKDADLKVARRWSPAVLCRFQADMKVSPSAHYRGPWILGKSNGCSRRQMMMWEGRIPTSVRPPGIS